jgi:hypothetical protein
MKEALIQLLKVKSILSLIIAVVFAEMAVTGGIDSKDTFMVIVMVFTFFFGKQDSKV